MRKLGCGSCGGGNSQLGKFVPGNTTPAYIAARARGPRRSISPMQMSRGGLSGLGFDMNLGFAELITGIPNLYLIGGAALVLILMMKR